jgi:hypothetical protein
MKCGIPLEAWMRWGLGQGECARVESVVSQVVEETWRIYRETLARWAKNLHFSAKTQLWLVPEHLSPLTIDEAKHTCWS